MKSVSRMKSSLRSGFLFLCRRQRFHPFVRMDFIRISFGFHRHKVSISLYKNFSLRSIQKKKKQPVYSQIALQCRRRPIFPGSCPPSIFGTIELNYRVRDGNGWNLNVIDTDWLKSFPLKQGTLYYSKCPLSSLFLIFLLFILFLIIISS